MASSTGTEEDFDNFPVALSLHPEFVRIADGSRVILLREGEFVQMLAALRQYEGPAGSPGRHPLVDRER